MTSSNSASIGWRPAGSRMTNLDRLVSGFRRWVEDRLPWYDREEEQDRIRRTERIRRRSIEERIRAEAILAQHRFGR